jgi:sodium-dependent phosphate transporter
MPALPQFDYIFAIATLFAFLDAWNIGMYQLFHATSLHIASELS